MSPDAVGDHEPSLVAVASSRVGISVLQRLELCSVTLTEIGRARLYMGIGDMPRAIGEASDRVKQARADDVAKLKTGVIVAVAESGQLEKLSISRLDSELLCENGMGNPDVLILLAPVGDADPGIADLPEKMVEI